jgi:hypothetical protein
MFNPGIAGKLPLKYKPAPVPPTRRRTIRTRKTGFLNNDISRTPTQKNEKRMIRPE